MSPAQLVEAVRNADVLVPTVSDAITADILKHTTGKLRSLITSISKQLEQKRIHPEKSGEQQHAAVAVLDIRRMDNGVQQQS